MWQALLMSCFRGLDLPGFQGTTYHSAVIEDYEIFDYGQPAEMPAGSDGGLMMEYITCTPETMAAIQDDERFPVIWAEEVKDPEVGDV